MQISLRTTMIVVAVSAFGWAGIRALAVKRQLATYSAKARAFAQLESDTHVKGVLYSIAQQRLQQQADKAFLAAEDLGQKEALRSILDRVPSYSMRMPSRTNGYDSWEPSRSQETSAGSSSTEMDHAITLSRAAAEQAQLAAASRKLESHYRKLKIKYQILKEWKR